ncbi:hypothetical protein SPRG_03692 [Saprolegnia parasitica CBS 223.65]|uniref:Uncharacterized protein n=1 Tax=Saprolegnia parasitica (strain CBS 223.65) TaxID=695850 RepID=A0A067CYA4_SAPPC|nr:hypothetical protein SPRG_03692 [Saprolegnia parasitica CBS 223.65]KDO31772.1 hypothetical protein SPRG_03692 [Saprolegnia parasitica CBS 223.65]|eukprot:XP_012197652.1 hypothetical protein SPRG_03692 [Saprolegnia parasitica CBS 223.65]
MAPKRKPTPSADAPPAKKTASSQDAARKAKAKTMKARIVYILSVATQLVGPLTIKKRLFAEFGVTESKLFASNFKKALKELGDENRDDFGRVGGSYHGGTSSPAYLARVAEEEADTAHAAELAAHEDSVARGGEYECSNCHKTFWTWISDGYVYGHPIEYRYGDGKDDYADLRD